MKFLLASFIISLSLTANAQNQRQNLENRTLRVVQRLQTVVSNNLSRLSNRDLQEIIRISIRAKDIATGQATPPPRPPAPSTYFVNAILEDSRMLLEAYDLQSLKSTCLAKVDQVSSGSVDDISVSVNNSASTSKHTSGWWNTSEAKCNTVVSLAIEAAFNSNQRVSHMAYVISGDADDNSIIAEGNNLVELESSCLANVHISSSADDISIRLNGGEIKSQHNRGWWKTPQEVCNVAISLAFSN